MDPTFALDFSHLGQSGLCELFEVEHHLTKEEAVSQTRKAIAFFTAAGTTNAQSKDDDSKARKLS